MADALAAGLHDGWDRSTLVRDAQAGDHVAFDRLIRPGLDRQLRFAMSLVRDEMDARDVVQEACLRAWRELPRLRDATRFDSWMNQILANTARNHLRTQRRIRVREIRSVEVDVDNRPDAERSLSETLPERDLVRRAFDLLDADKRVLLAMHYVDGRPVLEIARMLGIPEGTAKWRLHAARAALERTLEAEDR